MFSDDIKARYNDLINQNTSVSERIAQNIKMADLDGGTTEMVSTALLEVERACSEKSFGDRCIEMLPAVIGNRVQKQVDKIERLNMKHSNIAQVATKHFDVLARRRDIVKENVMSLIDIREKLEQSTELLLDLRADLADGMEEVKTRNTAEAKKDLLICKELSVQIASQIAIQKDLINQLDMVEFTADVVLDTLNQTLPDLKSNFIDQISITTALDNLKTFKDNVDRTRQMTIGLQEQTFENTKNIMIAITDQGVGLNEADIGRLEKLNNEKAKLGQTISAALIRNSKQLDQNLIRVNHMIDNSVGTFDSIRLEDLSHSGEARKYIQNLR